MYVCVVGGPPTCGTHYLWHYMWHYMWHCEVVPLFASPYLYALQYLYALPFQAQVYASPGVCLLLWGKSLCKPWLLCLLLWGKSLPLEGPACCVALRCEPLHLQPCYSPANSPARSAAGRLAGTTQRLAAPAPTHSRWPPSSPPPTPTPTPTPTPPSSPPPTPTPTPPTPPAPPPLPTGPPAPPIPNTPCCPRPHDRPRMAHHHPWAVPPLGPRRPRMALTSAG